MIDMNGSIENIMEECDRIAFNEFKGDIAAGYASSRRLNYFSGDHKIGKRQSDMAKKAAMRGGEGNRGTDDHYKDIAGSGKVTHDKYNAYNAKQDSYTKMRNNQESKPKRESASIFDGMFQALDEFKGDAELQHQARDFHDFMSGSHEYSKAYKSDKNRMRDELSARTGRNGQANSKAKKEELDKDKDNSREELKTLRNVASRDKLAKNVLSKESASIFDDLFDQI